MRSRGTFPQDAVRGLLGNFYVDSQTPDTIYRVDGIFKQNDVWYPKVTIYDFNGVRIGRKEPGFMLAEEEPKTLIECMDDKTAPKSFKPIKVKGRS